jgi:hypothetical protein
MDPAGTCASSRRRFLGWRDGSEAPAPIVVWETYHAPSYAAAVVSEPCRRCIGAIAIWQRGLRRGTPFRHLTGVRRRSERVSPMDESRPRRRASKNLVDFVRRGLRHANSIEHATDYDLVLRPRAAFF